MADTVRYHMEEMVPELEDLQRRGFFSAAELKQIAAKRTNFEYLLKRRAPLKADFLRCDMFLHKFVQRLFENSSSFECCVSVAS